MSVKRGDIYGIVGLIIQSTQLHAQVIFSEPMLMGECAKSCAHRSTVKSEPWKWPEFFCQHCGSNHLSELRQP